MTTKVPLTDAIIEAALARRAARVDSAGLHDEIMAGIARTPQARKPLVARPSWLTWPASSPQLAWLVLVMVLLLLALAGGLLIAGSSPRNLLRNPQSLVAPGIEVLAPGPLENPSVVVGSDGLVWAYTTGHLVRLDPTSGDTRTWDIADDAAFAGPALAPAWGAGVWLVGGHDIRWFDGEGFSDVVAAPHGVTSLWSAAESPDGTLWVSAAERGVFRWDGEAWTSVAAVRSDVVADTIALDSSGHVWVAGMTYPGPVAQGVSRFDGSHWTTFTASDAPALAGTAQSIAPMPDGTIWVGTEVGIARFDGTSWTSFGASQIGASGSWSVAVGPDGLVWAATGSHEDGVGIARYDGTTWTLFGSPDGLPGPDANGYSDASVAASKDGVFASTNAGLFRLAEGRWERAWSAAEEATAPLLDLVAVSGAEAWGLWVGAWGEGVNEIWHFQGSVSSRESSTEGVPPGVRDLALAPDGTLWAATDHGVAARSNGRWTVVDPRPARGVAIGADGIVWIGGGSSAPETWTLRREGAAWVAEAVPDSPLDGGGPSMTIDRGGNLWISGAGRGWVEPLGLFRFDRLQWDAMHPIANVGDVRVENIVSGPDGDVWVIPTWVSNAWPDPATQVARFDGTRWTVFGTGDGLPADNVGLSLAIAPDGTVWLSSIGGLCSFDGERWTVRSKGHDFGTVAVAPNGTLWASGQGGVVRIAPPSP